MQLQCNYMTSSQRNRGSPLTSSPQQKRTKNARPFITQTKLRYNIFLLMVFQNIQTKTTPHIPRLYLSVLVARCLFVDGFVMYRAAVFARYVALEVHTRLSLTFMYLEVVFFDSFDWVDQYDDTIVLAAIPTTQKNHFTTLHMLGILSHSSILQTIFSPVSGSFLLMELTLIARSSSKQTVLKLKIVLSAT